MKSQNYNKIIKTLKTKGFKKIEIDPVLESKFILQRSGEYFKIRAKQKKNKRKSFLYRKCI